MDDLNAAKTPGGKAFFDLYYAPNNATLTVAGDFDTPATKALIQQYFGDIPRAPDAPPLQECKSSFGTGQIRKVWPDPKASLPAVVLAYRVPEYKNDDMPVIELLATILGQGESSRINRTVVREKKLAQGAFVFANLFGPRRGPGNILALAISNTGVTPDSLEAGLAAEFARLVQEGVTEQELTKAKNAYRTQLITQQQQALNKAEALQSASLFLGSHEAVNTNWKRFLAVTTADVKRVAGAYLRPENSLVLLIIPGAAQ